MSIRIYRWRPAMLFAVLIGMMFPFKTASAHGDLRSSVPAKEEKLSVAPSELRLTFSKAPELAISSVVLTGSNGQVLLDSIRGISGDPFTIVTGIRGALEPGVYTVVWKIISADGHPRQGDFSFTIQAGAAGITARQQHTPPLSVTPPSIAEKPVASFDVESPAYVIIRWFEFLVLIMLLGALAFHYFVLRFFRRQEHFNTRTYSSILILARNRVATLGLWAAFGFAISALLRLYAQSYAMHGFIDMNMIKMMLAHTVWGGGWILHATAAILAIIGFSLARNSVDVESSRSNRIGWAIAAIGGVVAAYTPALSGHAASSSQLVPLVLFADGLHVIGAGGWLGSLAALVCIGLPSAMTLPHDERGHAVADFVNAFSPTALVFAAIVAVTGVFAAWIHVGTIPALWQTSYGKILLLKLGVLSAVAGIGAYNWLRVKPALGGIDGVLRIRRSAVFELVIGAVVLLVTAILVAIPTPME